MAIRDQVDIIARCTRSKVILAALEEIRLDLRARLQEGGGVCYGSAGRPGECTTEHAHLGGCPEWNGGK